MRISKKPAGCAVWGSLPPGRCAGSGSWKRAYRRCALDSVSTRNCAQRSGFCAAGMDRTAAPVRSHQIGYRPEHGTAERVCALRFVRSSARNYACTKGRAHRRRHHEGPHATRRGGSAPERIASCGYPGICTDSYPRVRSSYRASRRAVSRRDPVGRGRCASGAVAARRHSVSDAARKSSIASMSVMTYAGQLASRDKPLAWLHVEVKSPPFSRTARVETGFLWRRLQRGNAWLCRNPDRCPVSGRVAMNCGSSTCRRNGVSYIALMMMRL
jgi:hypothetical protein